jgi:diguanylate cyclase (GGDEF)-like protein
MKKKLLSFATIIMMLMVYVSPGGLIKTAFAADESQILLNSDFEDGIINAWTSFGGGGKLELDSSFSHSGDYSLKVTERSQSYHGPSFMADEYFRPNKTYSFSAWIYQASTTQKTFSWTLKYVDSLGTAQFMQLAGGEIPPNVWTEITGTVTMPEDSMNYLTYFECANASVEFNIDDVVIIGDKNDHEETGTNKKGYLYSFDFETGNELWAPRGDNRLIRTDEYSYTGDHSILVTNRNRTWNGPTVTINDVKRGVSYFYSAYIMYTGDEYEDVHGFRMELQYNLGGETTYQLITAKDVQKDKWTRITGTFTLPEDAADIAFYLQTRNIDDGEEITDNDLLPFYTDNVIISETAVIHKETAIKTCLYFLAALAAALIIRCIFIVISKRLKKKKAVLKSIAKDAMTQCYNRNAYEKRIAELTADPEKCKGLWFALCDVNFLKYINDNLGHEKGDEAITRCGQLLMNVVGNDGDVYRTGGDEFVCITTKPMQEQIREALEKESEDDKGYPFAVASGFAAYDPETDGDKPDAGVITERSDKEMYANKQEIKSKNTDYSRK